MEGQDGETVYDTQQPEDGRVMSERVQSLAGTVYSEFERMIKRYDEDVVKELMPLVVNVLETLDLAYSDKQENEVELELLRDDNEQLLTQYEREKQLRKASEQKYLESEDGHEEEKKKSDDQMESLESILRMLELKSKNAQDHISRLEDKEAEMKKEYNKLHERYTELFRTHMDYMERTKILMGADPRMMEMGASPGVKRGEFRLPNLRPTGMGLYESGETPVKVDLTPSDLEMTSPGARSQDSSTSLKQELRYGRGARETAEKAQLTDRVTMEDSCAGTKPTSKEAVEGTDIIKKPDMAGKDSIKPGAGSQPADTAQEAPPTVKTPARTKADTLLQAAAGKFDDENFHEALGGDDGTMGNMVTSPETEEFDESLGGPLKSTPTGGKKGNESSIFDELTSTGSDLIGEMDDGVDITGMSKEVENLILENTELLATKNALNIVKDDLIAKVDELSSEQEILREEITSLQTLKTKLKERVSELEEELKKAREELSKRGPIQENQDEDDVPMAQRKRFTRVEMARVLMERNQYKERLMELQEAVRWTEMIRASREHPDLVQKQKSKSSIWNFFSNLFSSTNKPEKRAKNSSTATVRYSAPTTQVRPVGDPNKKSRDKYNLGEKSRAYDFMQDDLLTEKARRDRDRERREQYKQVRAHVKKEDGRMQAYGWSLPAKYQPPMLKSDAGNKSQVPVPVPVYCRPLLDKDSQMKIWCACGINLSGGKTKDGGAIVGASVFYSVPPSGDSNKMVVEDDVDQLDQELQDRERLMRELEQEQQGMSSMVWICTTANSSSSVSVIDANQPGQILATFHVTSSHVLCIASVPGAMEGDYQRDEDILKAEPEAERDPRRSASPAPGNEMPEHRNIGGITFVQCATGGCASPRGSPQLAPDLSKEAQAELAALGQLPDDGPQETQDIETKEERDPKEKEKDELEVSAKVTRATGSPARSGSTSPAPSQPEDRPGQPEVVKDGLSPGTEDEVLKETEEQMSSVQPTVWMGTQSGSLYVHSAVSQWKRCIHSVKLKDSVLSIVHTRGRVLAALADGTVAVFHRAAGGQWDLKNYHLVDLGRPHHSIRCMSVVANQYVWCGYRNKVHVLDPKTLKLQRSFDAHPRRESQVRQLAWVGDGVWISIRLDSTLRLYHAYTYQHLQDVDIEPYVSKMLGTGKLGFSFVRITALLASVNRLWIGTGNGVIISVPLSESNRQAVTTVTQGGRPSPGGVVRVYSDTSDSVTPGSYIPYCSMAQAQLSFHGHKDAVKFFSSVPGSPAKGLSGVNMVKETGDNKMQSESGTTEQNMLVISGGQGYIDFRVGDGDDDEAQTGIQEEKNLLGKGDRSHLIVWKIAPS